MVSDGSSQIRRGPNHRTWLSHRACTSFPLVLIAFWRSQREPRLRDGRDVAQVVRIRPGPWYQVELRRTNPCPPPAKVVATTGGSAAAQVKRAAGRSASDRESPWVTSLTGTWGARSGVSIHGVP